MNYTEYAIYVASVLGAASLMLMMPRQGFVPRRLGALLGASTLGGLWLYLARFLPESFGPGTAVMIYYYIFSALAIGSAARVITHPKPVFSALWFVMVVLASAGLFLVLEAEFVALAMVIIYGGAILVTYVFVIMLAAQSGDPADAQSSPIYDRVAREPVAVLAAGFFLLAVLLTVMFQPMSPNEKMQAALEKDVIAQTLTSRPAARTAGELRREGVTPPAGEDPAGVTNVERIGLDLFENHPLGLELAGVILLISLVGAVVIARQQVPAESNQNLNPPQV